MLKYNKRFASIKTISTFANVLIQQRYTNGYISIQKNHYIILKHFKHMEAILVFLIICFFGFLFFNPNTKEQINTNHENKF
jgi:uncharacterized membrane protein YukC